MESGKRWDGSGKGSRLGNLIVVKLIELVGPFPAHIVVLMAALRYTLFDKTAISALKIFRKNIGLTGTNLFQLHRHFCSFGFSMVDKFALLSLKKPTFKYECINEDLITDILDEVGKGVILLTAHIGSWEIAGNLLTNRKKVCVNAVVLDNEHEKLKEIYKEALDKREFNLIKVSKNGLDMMLPIKEALSKNEIVCLAGDRVMGSGGVEIEFFGKKAEFPIGPFQIAAITGAPIIPVFVVKDKFNHYRFEAFKPILFDNATRDNRHKLIDTGMKKFISNIEKIAKKYPYQWFNFYNIWKD